MKYLAIIAILLLLISFSFATTNTVVSEVKEFNTRLIQEAENEIKLQKELEATKEALIGEMLIIYQEQNSNSYQTDNYIDSTIYDPSNDFSNNQIDNVPDSIEGRIHNLINLQRKNNGLSDLAWDNQLSSIARAHSSDMASRNYFSHTSRNGNNFSDRYASAGYDCQVPSTNGYTYFGAENIAQDNTISSVEYIGNETYYNENTDEDIAINTVYGWMNSTGHRNNILSGLWDKEGIGVATATNGKVYITQNFC